MAISAERAVREYMVSLRDPSRLRDDSKLAELRQRLDQSEDELERVRLQQQVLEAESPAVDGYENRFIDHAKAWADKTGVSEQAFLAEGVPAKVLRKAGFGNVGRSATRSSGRSTGSRTAGKRVSAEEVRASIPKGTFTIKDVQDASGASAAVVRRVVNEEVQAGNVKEMGPDAKYRGRGRAPTQYSR